MAKKRHHHYKLTPSGTLYTPPQSIYQPVNEISIQDALRAFLSPIKNDDTCLDFYTVYKREATEYDTDYVKKYDEDLNTTLIFVRHLSPALTTYLTCFRRRVYSPPSALPSSSISSRGSYQTRMNNQRLSSARSSLLSTSPPSLTSPLPLRPYRKIHPVKSSPYVDSCMQAS